MIRACNPERVEWLTLGSAGWRSCQNHSGSRPNRLKVGGYLRGLVGYRKMRRPRCAAFGQASAGFSPLVARGGKVDGYGIAPGRKVFAGTDAGQAAEHFLVETAVSLILVDSKGAAYVPISMWC